MAEDINNSLFSQDELDSMESGYASRKAKSGPVTVLGHTFENDEERRVFFREELRKKLPELKQLEGYPIGTDDDIIALSDPPYYTACPNPWINDLVASWEEEKIIMVDKGKRDVEKIVTEPYASDVSEGKNNPVYLAHSYHTKVPHPAIMRYILHYTEPGDIVFDGFSGTGMTGVAANNCEFPDPETKHSIEQEWENTYHIKPKWGKRHAICTDLSPIATFIASNYNTPIDEYAFDKELRDIIRDLEKECSWMYETKLPNGEKAMINFTVCSDEFVCPNCGEKIVFWKGAINKETCEFNESFPCPGCGCQFDKKTFKKLFKTKYNKADGSTYQIVESIPVYISCTDLRGKRREKDATVDDLKVLERIEEIDNPHYIPNVLMPEGSKTNDPLSSHHITHAFQFFTPRNLYVLSAFLDRTQDKSQSAKLKFIFTGILNRSSKMNRFSVHNYYFGGGGWCKGGLNGTLYVPSLPVEVSVLEQVKTRSDSFLRIKDFLPTYYDNVVAVESATKLNIRDNSVDYIFVDPPFGANIMYSELNFLSEAWLKVLTNNKEEAIVDNSSSKDLFDYQTLMSNSFREFYRILKPGKWITIEFSNTSSSVWNSIQNSLQNVGFIVANIAALDKKQGSYNAVMSTTAVKQDLVISCFKPSEKFQLKFEESTDPIQNVWDFVDEYLEHLPVHIEKGNATTTVIERNPKILYDRLISYYVQKGLPVPFDAQTFQQELRERFIERDGMFFTLTQVSEYEKKKALAPEFVPMGLIVSNEADGIEWLRNQLRDNPQTYQDIQPNWLQAINGLRKGDILPELSVLLEENFIQNPDETWRLPNIQDDIDKETLRSKALLREFKLYVEQASKPKAKIKEVRVEAVRAGFKKCYMEKDFATIVKVGDKIPQNLLTEDDILLQFYDIARTRG